MMQMVKSFGVTIWNAWKVVINFKVMSVVLLFSIILLGKGTFNGYFNDTYNESRGIVEHIDLSISNYRFKLTHFVNDKNKNLLLAEEEEGVAIKLFNGKYHLLPLHYQKTFSAIKYIASFDELGSIRACLYDFDKKSRKRVLFLDNDRGGIVLNGQSVYPSSLFLEGEGHDNSFLHSR